MDARVQDYLEDQLQSVADLESLDSLLQNVRAQQVLLKKQLEDARKDHANAARKAEEQSEAARLKAAAFQKEQEDIDRTLLIVTQSEVSDDAVEKFEASMGKLQKLDVATGYVELLITVDTLKNECVSQLEKSQDAALGSYRKLQQLSTSLRPLQDAADGAAPHLLDHIQATIRDLCDTIQRTFADNFGKTLQKMNWPKVATTVPLALQQAWATDVSRLLDLQRHDLEAREHEKPQSRDGDVPVLLPFEALVLPLEQRFSYHFSGNKPTNRLDKPEFFLNHTIELISRYSDFVQDTMQPILLRHFRGSDLAFTPAYIDATTAFITALLPMLELKLVNVASQLSSQPSPFSHLVQEVISFDLTLSESYSYTPASASVAWRGLSYYLLDTCGYFQQWLTAERDFALARYDAIIENAEAGELDFDSVAQDVSKPTKAAIRVNDLLETITERYRYLHSYSQKIRFLIDIQIEIFDRFFQRLRAGLEAYRNRTSTVGRTINQVSKDEVAEVQGIRGLDRLCRIFGAADYLERAMRDWSDDVFFIELWAELEYRAKSQESLAGRNLGSWQEIQQKTSSALGDKDGAEDSGLQGALFDETAGKYRSIRVRSEAALVEALTHSVKQALKPYGTITTWASLSSSSSLSNPPASSSASSTSSPAPVSAELDPVIAFLTESLTFLRRALGTAALRRLARHICHAIQAFCWDHVLTAFKISFSTAGAAQLAVDVHALRAHIGRFVGIAQAQTGLRKLLEGVALLSLPVRGDANHGTTGKAGEGGAEDDDAAWAEEADVSAGQAGGVPTPRADAQGKMSLFQAERLVFMDNESARHALEQLGFSTLSEADARAVLGKRVELGS